MTVIYPECLNWCDPEVFCATLFVTPFKNQKQPLTLTFDAIFVPVAYWLTFNQCCPQSLTCIWSLSFGVDWRSNMFIGQNTVNYITIGFCIGMGTPIKYVVGPFSACSTFKAVCVLEALIYTLPNVKWKHTIHLSNILGSQAVWNVGSNLLTSNL